MSYNTNSSPSLLVEGDRVNRQGLSDIAIRVQNLSKCYHIYDAPRDRLKQFVLPRFQRLSGQAPKQYFREFWALKDLSFEVNKGETIGIIGKNGSGKSTLLQIICGTLTPTSGTVEIQGRVAALLELGAGFNPEFTGRENVYMNATMLGLQRSEVDARFDDIAAFADIGQFIDQPVKTYSSGMYVRLGFAVAAHITSDILVIDEALSVGDAFFVQKCMRFLRAFKENGTLIFVSHDKNAVLSLCKNAVWLGNGCVERIGNAKEITESYLADVHKTHIIKHNNITRSNENYGSTPSLTDVNGINRKSGGVANLNPGSTQFWLNPDSFGSGGATIMSVNLRDNTGTSVSHVEGEESISLVIRCLANVKLSNPIVGFFIKDRLGQTIFGDNTFLTYQDNPPVAMPGQILEAKFEFVMPRLSAGDYSICAAVAEGTQDEHIEHHWIHDALIFKAHPHKPCLGLIAVPIRLTTMHAG